MPTIRSIMKTKPIAVAPSTPMHEAIKLLVDHEVSGVAVVNDDDHVVGELSNRDVLRMFHENAVTVEQLMTANPQTFDVHAPFVDVVDCLIEQTHRRAFIEERGKLVGVVSRSDLMSVILTAKAS